MPRSIVELRRDAETIFRSALQAVDASSAVRRHLRLSADGTKLAVGLELGEGSELPLAGFRRCFVVGAGKAAAPMAAAVEEVLGERLPLRGSVNVKHGHTTPRPLRVNLVECAHPTPDKAGETGARAIEAILDELRADDLLIVVISGGASALLPAPVAGIELADKQAVTELLLRSGAEIEELNAVRKHLSRLKGGALLRRAGEATVIGLILSDVIGDRLDVIGSGLTTPDPSTFTQALAVLDKYALLGAAPERVVRYLREGEQGRRAETLKDVGRAAVRNVVVGSNRLALESARLAAEALGYGSLILSSTMQGESREAARIHVEILRESGASGNPVAPPACILSGGETTVTVRGSGKGGRNQEFALAAAIALEGLPGALLLAAGTDGTDGPTDAAGAMVDGQSVVRGRRLGLDAREHLARNDSYAFLNASGDLLRLGPTGTNVMDLVIMLADKGR